MPTNPITNQFSSDLIGRAEDDFAPADPRTGNKSELDRDAFLQLLTTQLANQDPLNPMEDKEFVAQLAQFSSLEQLNNISDSIADFKDAFARQETLSAINYIGKEIQADGRSISKDGGSISSFSYTLPDTAEKLYLNIFDTHGNIVRSITLPGRMPGEHQFAWDGKDHNGSALPDGVYSVSMAAEGRNGEPLMVTTQTSGVVSGIVNDGEQVVLRLQDGRRVNIGDVREVVGDTSNQALNGLTNQLNTIAQSANPATLPSAAGSTQALLESLGV